MAILGQGLVLMIAGMGIVYIFLSILIFITNVSMSALSRFDHLLPEDAPKKKPAPKVASSDGEAVAVALAVAMKG